MVRTEKIEVRTRGGCQVMDITDDVRGAAKSAALVDGTITVFNVGSTAAITTTEFEPGLANHDIEAAFERIAPRDGRYEHEQTWHDDNGHSHVRASLLGPSLTVPVIAGKLTLGVWQQIVLVEFDTRPRNRTIVCQMIGRYAP